MKPIRHMTRDEVIYILDGTGFYEDRDEKEATEDLKDRLRQLIEDGTIKVDVSKQITNELFDKKLIVHLLDEVIYMSEILSIPGVYELVSEYYNNEVIELCEKEIMEDILE